MERKDKKTVVVLISIIFVLLVLIILFSTNVISFKSDKHINYQPNGEVIDNNSDDEQNNDNSDDTEDNVDDKGHSDACIDYYMYTVKVTNKNGAKVYNDFNKEYQQVVDTLKPGTEIKVVTEFVDGYQYNDDTNKYSYKDLDEIKDYYYYIISSCGEYKYVKFSDVKIIESSIVNPDTFEETRKYYVHDDVYLFSGPSLVFEEKDNNKIIKKGTILNVDKYIRNGAVWLYVNINGYSGWVLEQTFNSEDYSYNNIKYGSAVLLYEEKGSIKLEKELNLYKYAFSTDKVIDKISKGTMITYDYCTSGEPGIMYYHINYNGNSGWIMIELE